MDRAAYSVHVKYFLLICISIVFFCPSFQAQTKPNSKQDPPEMLLTEQGFIAMNTPTGWERSRGPGLAFFLRKGVTAKKADAWIYLSSSPIGPKEEDKDADAFIQSDIAGFHRRFRNGGAQKEEPISLPSSGVNIPVYTFRSGEQHNAFERIAYVAERERVLIVVLSAKNELALKQSLSAFQEFVTSYKGSIILGNEGDSDARKK